MANTNSLSPPGSSVYSSDTLHVGDGTWDSERDTFLLPNLKPLNFETTRYNGMGNRFRDVAVYHRLIVAHAVIGALAFLLLIPAAIFIVRFGDHSSRGGRTPPPAVRWHIWLQILTFLLATAALTIGWFAVGSSRSLTNPHHAIGVALYVLVVVQVLAGSMLHHVSRRLPHARWRVASLKRMLHQWIGRATAILGLAQIPLGLALYGSPVVFYVLYALVMSTYLVVYFVLSYHAEKRRATYLRQMDGLAAHHGYSSHGPNQSGKWHSDSSSSSSSDETEKKHVGTVGKALIAMIVSWFSYKILKRQFNKSDSDSSEPTTTETTATTTTTTTTTSESKTYSSSTPTSDSSDLPSRPRPQSQSRPRADSRGRQERVPSGERTGKLLRSPSVPRKRSSYPSTSRFTESDSRSDSTPDRQPRRNSISKAAAGTALGAGLSFGLRRLFAGKTKAEPEPDHRRRYANHGQSFSNVPQHFDSPERPVDSSVDPFSYDRTDSEFRTNTDIRQAEEGRWHDRRPSRGRSPSRPTSGNAPKPGIFSGIVGVFKKKNKRASSYKATEPDRRMDQSPSRRTRLGASPSRRVSTGSRQPRQSSGHNSMSRHSSHHPPNRSSRPHSNDPAGRSPRPIPMPSPVRPEGRHSRDYGDPPVPSRNPITQPTESDFDRSSRISIPTVPSAAGYRRQREPGSIDDDIFSGSRTSVSRWPPSPSRDGQYDPTRPRPRRLSRPPRPAHHQSLDQSHPFHTMSDLSDHPSAEQSTELASHVPVGGQPQQFLPPQPQHPPAPPMHGNQPIPSSHPGYPIDETGQYPSRQPPPVGPRPPIPVGPTTPQGPIHPINFPITSNPGQMPDRAPRLSPPPPILTGQGESYFTPSPQRPVHGRPLPGSFAPTTQTQLSLLSPDGSALYPTDGGGPGGTGHSGGGQFLQNRRRRREQRSSTSAYVTDTSRMASDTEGPPDI